MRSSFVRALPVRRLLPAVVILLVFAVYAAVLQGASIYDDAVEIQQMAFVPMSDAWTVQLNGYYRPLRAVLWIAARDLFGWFTPAVLHWFNLAAHVLTTSLVYALTRRYSSSVGGVAAALIFGVFPWSYEAVLWSAAVYHPLMHACGLGALLLMSSRDVRLRTSVGAALLLAAALLSHELAVLYVPLMAVMVVFVNRSRTTLVQIFPAAFGACVFLLLKIFVPPTTATSIDADFARIAQNLVILLQGPAAPLIVLLRSGFGVLGLPPSPQRESIVISFAAAVFIAGWALVLPGRRRLLLAAAGFMVWGLFSLAIAGSLSVEYVLTSPRLHYSGAIGLTMFFAAGCAAVWDMRLRLLRSMLVIALLVWCVWCVRYVAVRVFESARVGAVLREITSEISTSSAEAQVLVVNFPFWNAPRYPEFLLGNEGLQIYQEGGSGPDGFLFAQTGERRSASFISVPASDDGSGAFAYAYYQDRSGISFDVESVQLFSHVYRVEYGVDGPQVRRIAVRAPRDGNFTSGAVFFSDAAAPPAVELAVRDVNVCEGMLFLDLQWGVRQKIPADVTIFVHVYDADGIRLVAADADPGERMLPLSLLRSDEVLREERAVELPAAQNAHELRIGLYRRGDGGRYTVRGVDGAEYPDGELRMQISHCSTSSAVSQPLSGKSRAVCVAKSGECASNS